jgi:ABC-type transport system involved in multi-copper enzyme maturation permease subunit
MSGDVADATMAAGIAQPIGLTRGDGLTAGAAFRAAWQAEWIKWRSVPGSTWAVVGLVGSTVLLTVFLSAVGSTNANEVGGRGDDDVVVNSLRGAYLGEVAAAVLGVQVFVSEYGTRLVRATFTAVPGRGTVLAAKAAVVSPVVAVAGLFASVTSFLLAQPLLHNGGFEPPAYPLVGLDDPQAQRAVLGTALFFTALALLGLAVGAVVRSAAAAVSLLVGLLLVPFVMGGLLPEEVSEPLRRLTPMAGLAIQSTPARGPEWPIGPWPGLGVTWAWAGAALVVAWLVLRRRDV